MSMESNSSKGVIYYLKIILLPLLLGIGVLFILYKDVDFNQIFNILENEVSIPILLFSLLFGFIAHTIRGFRWYLLVRPLQDRKPRIINSVLTVLGSYAVSMVVPRSGEFWRCWYMGKYENIRFDKLLGTLITDRIIDIIILLSIVSFIGFIFTSEFTSFLNNNNTITNYLLSIIHSYWLYTIIVLAICTLIIGIFWLKKRPDNKFVKLIKGVIVGIQTIRSMPHKWLFIMESLLIWICYFLFFYINFYAFPFTQGLGIEAGVIAFAFSSMSAIVPVQGGIGAWHFLVISTFSLWNISDIDSKSFALIVHSMQTLSISLVGLIAIFLLPLVNRVGQRSKNTV